MGAQDDQRTSTMADMAAEYGLRRYIRRDFWRAFWTPRLLQVFLYFLLAVAFSAANNVSLRYMYASYGQRYSFFVNQWTTLWYCLIVSSVTLYKLWFTNDITPAMRRFPAYKFLIMACFDASSGVLGAIGAPGTPGQIQTLTQQTIVPITMVASLIFLKARYVLREYAGAFIIVVGATVAALGGLIHPSTNAATKLIWYSLVIYESSNLPNALSSVYKEAAMKSSFDLDVWYLTTVVSWAQFIISFAFLPLQSVPGFGDIKLHELPDELYNGARCFFGYGSAADTDVHCHGAWMSLMAYVVLNMGFNVVLLYVTKAGSATLLSLSYAVALPVANLTFTIHPIMGRFTEKFTPFDIGGLVIVLAGLSLYSFGSSNADERDADGRVIKVPKGAKGGGDPENGDAAGVSERTALLADGDTTAGGSGALDGRTDVQSGTTVRVATPAGASLGGDVGSGSGEGGDAGGGEDDQWSFSSFWRANRSRSRVLPLMFGQVTPMVQPVPVRLGRSVERTRSDYLLRLGLRPPQRPQHR